MTSAIENEIDHNGREFYNDWTKQLVSNHNALAENKVYKESYRRLCCLQALKSEIVTKFFNEKSAAFFIEAHNDALTSHVSASFGAWRLALQSLRSSIENALCALYYKDHPVELELWSKGKFRIGFTDLFAYASKHPQIDGLPSSVCGLEIIKDEYTTLSKAVHASAVDFRMTDNASKVLLWNTETVKANKWASREQSVVQGICLLIISHFCEQLQGTKLTQLREVLFFGVSVKQRELIKEHLHITIPKP